MPTRMEQCSKQQCAYGGSILCWWRQGWGAVFGGMYAVLIEIGGFLHGNSSAVLPLMFPAGHGPRGGQLNAIQTAGLLLVQVAGNMVGFAVLFSVPVAVVVGVRRIFRRG